MLALALAASLAAIVPVGTAGATPVATATAASSAVVDDARLAADEARIPQRCGKPPVTGCRLVWHGKQAPTLVLWGDSHSWMMTPAVKEAVRKKKINVVLFFLGGCIPAIPDKELYAGNACAELSYDTMRYLLQLKASGRPYRLLMGAFWGANLDRLFWYEDQESRDIMKQRRVYTLAYNRPLFHWLGDNGIPTDVQAQGPAAIPPTECTAGASPFWCPISRHRAYFKDTYIRKWLARRMAYLPRRAKLIDYSNGICSRTTCEAVDDGVHTWFDPYHVSATKAATLARYYKPTVRALLRSR